MASVTHLSSCFLQPELPGSGKGTGSHERFLHKLPLAWCEKTWLHRPTTSPQEHGGQGVPSQLPLPCHIPHTLGYS
jgi:hypothetical protein